jgi:protein-tyrosine phosphatase
LQVRNSKVLGNAENVPVSRIDLHLHLLPGLDDGAPDEATALAHAARMVAEGIGVATVTPHIGSPYFPVDPLEIRERTAVLQEALDREGIALSLRAGGEVHPDGAADLTTAQLDAIAHGPRGGRWVLAEVPFAGIDERFMDGLDAITRRGFGVVIAHPERAAGVLHDGGLARLRPALEAGAVLQVNACSLMGRQGEEAQEAARRLVRSRLAYVIASDGHPGHRDHTVAEGEAPAAAAGASRAQIDALTRSNPRFLLQHGLPAAAPVTPGAALLQRDRSLSRARDEARRLPRAATRWA